MIFYSNEFPESMVAELPDAPKPKGNPGRKKRPTYKAVVCAFDIETTALRKYRQSIMYVWQLQIGMEITIVGRTWDEFIDLLTRLQNVLHDTKLVTYVHNLSHEFQYLSGIWHFTEDDVFCTEPRSILHCVMGCFEFRCSYRLSNMSLSQFTKQMRVAHRKLSGEKFDYNKTRYPWTKLSKYEMDYATYDVIGLVEAVTQLMTNEGDTLYTIPMTSTGYVRRDVKKAMKTYNWESMRRMIPSYELHTKMRKAFRGGNTHANRHFVGKLITDGVYSFDISSSYPATMLLKEKPMGRWYEVSPDELSIEYLDELLNKRHKAALMELAFYNIRLKDPRFPVPYLPIDKCEHVDPYTHEDLKGKKLRYSNDNGRIMAAKYLETILTDVDLRIVSNEYVWDRMEIKYAAFSTYGMLPKQIRELVLDYYVKKTSLKGVESEQWLYDASKRKINSIYGCSVQDPIQHRYVYDDDCEIPYRVDNTKSDEQLYNHQIRNAFQCYSWGCWITAQAREKLEQGIVYIYKQGEKEKKETGVVRTHFIYCDTDSIKFVGHADMSTLNDIYIKEAIQHGAYADDRKGKRHYIGVFENETMDKNGNPAPYPAFLTWGAKKYVYRDYTSDIRQTVAGTGDTWHITIAGVNKDAGAKELERAGGAAALLPDALGQPSFIFKEAGGLEAVYNDNPPIKELKIDGHNLKITRNLYLEKHAYTLGITDEFNRIILHPDLWRDLIDTHAAI